MNRVCSVGFLIISFGLMSAVISCGRKEDRKPVTPPAPEIQNPESQPEVSEEADQSQAAETPAEAKVDNSKVVAETSVATVDAEKVASDAEKDEFLPDYHDGYEEYCNLRKAKAAEGDFEAKLTKPHLRTAHMIYEHMLSKGKELTDARGLPIEALGVTCRNLPDAFQSWQQPKSIDLTGITIEDFRGIPFMVKIREVRLANTSLPNNSESLIADRLSGVALLELSENLALRDCQGLSMFTAIRDLRVAGTGYAFEFVECKDFFRGILPKLVAFDISKNILAPDLTDGFLAAEGSANLRVLRMSDVKVPTYFTEFDLTKFPNLVALDISGTSLSIKQGTPEASLKQIKYLDVRANPNASEIVKMFPNLEYLVTSDGTEIVKGRAGLKGLSVNALWTINNRENSVRKIYKQCNWDDLKASEKTLEFIDCTGAETRGFDEIEIKGQAFNSEIKNFTKPTVGSYEIDDLEFTTGKHMGYLRKVTQDLSFPEGLY